MPDKKLPKPCPECRGFGILFLHQYFMEQCLACRGTGIKFENTEPLLEIC